MLKSIIFDFDGVICESIETKKEAFRKLFSDYPEHIDEIVNFHMKYGGMSRFEKFKIIYRDMLKKELDEETSQKLGKLFSDYALQGVIESEFVEGAHEFLKFNYDKWKLFVASGTPDEEMKSIVNIRQLDQYFVEVFGSPKTKGVIISEILQKYDLKNDEVIFVGDSITDLKGANEANVKFIGRVHERYDNPFVNEKIEASLNDLSTLSNCIETINV